MARNWNITKDKFLSAEQVRILYRHLDDAKDLAVLRKKNYSHVRDYFLLRTLLETGLRVSELAVLKVSDFHNKSLIVRSGKGGKPRSIILSRSTQKLIADFIKIKKRVLVEATDSEAYLFISERGEPYSTRGLRKRVKLWFKRCGLPEHLSCHSCRHTYVSHLIAEGVDLTTVRDNAGHSSLAISSIYAHATKKELDVELYKE